jgi:PASTA domain
MRRPSNRQATAAAVVVGLGVLALAGRLLPLEPGARPPAATTASLFTGPARTEPVQTEGALVPQAKGRTLAQARAAMGRAGLPSDAVDRDPRDPGAVVVDQEPPAGAWVPPGSPVGFRTRTGVWPNATPRRLRLGQGATAATYRVVAADPVHDALELVLTMPRGADLTLWLRTPVGRRVMISSTKDLRDCRPTGREVRCLVTWAALAAEPPGVWTVGVAKRSPGAAAVRVRISFLPPS